MAAPLASRLPDLRIAILLIGISLALAGCFKSEAPLITVATADYPLPADARLDELKRDEHGGWTLDDANLRLTLEQSGTSKGWYVLHKPGERDPPRFLLKRIAEATFLVEDAQAEYGALRHEKGVWHAYFFNGTPSACEQLAAAERVRYHVSPPDSGSCRVDTLDGLSALVTHLIAAGTPADFAYVMR